MSKIPFTVYDVFAYLSSGSVVVASVDYLYGHQWLLQEKVPPVLAVFLLFLSYVVGHAVANFSAPVLEQFFVGVVLKRPSRTLMGEKPWGFLGRLFPGYYRALPEKTRERVREQATARGFDGSGEALFLHAYAVTTKEERTQQRLDEFRNVYGFARNMAFVFLLAAAVFCVGACFTDTPPNYWWAAIAAVLGVSMLYRYLKFFRQFSYQLLITYAELDRPSGERST